MHGYYFGYGAHSSATNNIAAVRPVPQPEPPDKAFKRYKSYLLSLRDSTDLYTKRIEEALTVCEELEKEF